MSQRNTKMMMLSAQKNKALRERFKESKQIQRNIQNIDPDFFRSDSDDDLPFSRYDSAAAVGQSLAQIDQSSNYFEPEDINFLTDSSTSRVEFNQQQQDQNLEISYKNISNNSLITLTTVSITEKNDLTEIPSPVFFSNINPVENIFNLVSPNTVTLVTETINDQQRSVFLKLIRTKLLYPKIRFKFRRF